MSIQLITIKKEKVVSWNNVTWSVVKCLSWNLSWQYRSTKLVFPTQPSPRRTILKWFFLFAVAMVFKYHVLILYFNFKKLDLNAIFLHGNSINSHTWLYNKEKQIRSNLPQFHISHIISYIIWNKFKLKNEVVLENYNER